MGCVADLRLKIPRVLRKRRAGSRVVKLDVRARNLDLPSSRRARIEKRVRLVVGHAVSELEAVGLTLEGGRESGRVTCRLALRCEDGERASLAESSREPDAAVDLALWRLERWLRRRALR